MSAAHILICRDCGTPIRHNDGRYRCPKCGAEVYLDGHGEEVWHEPERVLQELGEVAA